MDFYYDSSTSIGMPLFEAYVENAKALISNIERDKSLSKFDRFNRRFKISWGMEINFTDNQRIKSETTRNCYALMLKISDLWFAFEHLSRTIADTIPREGHMNSKVDLYTADTFEKLGCIPIREHFNQLLWEHVLDLKTWRQAMYSSVLPYLKNNTQGSAKKGITESIERIHERQRLAERHIFSLSYGIRILYVHEGVAAALGGKNYRVKECLYMVLYDTLILYSLVLGNAYCERKLLEFDS